MNWIFLILQSFILFFFIWSSKSTIFFAQLNLYAAKTDISKEPRWYPVIIKLVLLTNIKNSSPISSTFRCCHNVSNFNFKKQQQIYSWVDKIVRACIDCWIDRKIYTYYMVFWYWRGKSPKFPLENRRMAFWRNSKI